MEPLVLWRTLGEPLLENSVLQKQMWVEPQPFSRNPYFWERRDAGWARSQWCSSPTQAQGKHDPVFSPFTHTHTVISLFTLHTRQNAQTKHSGECCWILFTVSLSRWHRGDKARQTGAFILCMFILLPLLISRGTINIDQTEPPIHTKPHECMWYTKSNRRSEAWRRRRRKRRDRSKNRDR